MGACRVLLCCRPRSAEHGHFQHPKPHHAYLSEGQGNVRRQEGGGVVSSPQLQPFTGDLHLPRELFHDRVHAETLLEGVKTSTRQGGRGPRISQRPPSSTETLVSSLWALDMQTLSMAPVSFSCTWQAARARSAVLLVACPRHIRVVGRSLPIPGVRVFSWDLPSLTSNSDTMGASASFVSASRL